MHIDQGDLQALGVKEAAAQRFLPDLNQLLEQYNVNTPLRTAHFLSQVCHESGNMRITEENLNYQADRLLAVFPRYFSSRAAALLVAGSPERVGNAVYARKSLGNTSPGDGYKYRGRGLIQVTGKANYRELAEFLDVDVVTNPDLVRDQYAVASAVWYWHSRQLNRLADSDDVRAVTKRINGGLNGIRDRTRLLLLAKQALEGPADMVRRQPAEEILGHVTHHVNTKNDPLNVRDRPSDRFTRVALLPIGTPVDAEASSDKKADGKTFIQIRAALNGAIVSGWVDRKYLAPSGVTPVEEPPVPAPPAKPTKPTVAASGAQPATAASKAKQSPAAASKSQSTPTESAATHTVRLESDARLPVRERPGISAAWIASLPAGAFVEVIANRAEQGPHYRWIQIRFRSDSATIVGWIPDEFLEPLATPAPSPIAPRASLPECHLPNSAVVSVRDDGTQAHHLREPGMPRRTASRPSTRAAQLAKITNFLDPENPAHLRYAPKRVDTYCNIHAYDYCYLAGVFLPRVWWTDAALSLIRADVTVNVRYDSTVRELNANQLHDWLSDYGADFGWTRVFDLDPLQTAANEGHVCLITAKRTNLNDAGHIVAVVPENGGHHADRKSAGHVVRPLQSQAGRTNRTWFTLNQQWWTRAKYYADHGFWRHD